MYLRPESVRKQKKSWGIEAYRLADVTEPEEAPKYPDDVVVEPPEDAEEPIDKDFVPAGNWVVTLLSTIINFIKKLFIKEK